MEDEQPKKRGRGRPRKNKTQEEQPAPQSQDGSLEEATNQPAETTSDVDPQVAEKTSEVVEKPTLQRKSELGRPAVRELIATKLKVVAFKEGRAGRMNSQQLMKDVAKAYDNVPGYARQSKSAEGCATCARAQVNKELRIFLADSHNILLENNAMQDWKSAYANYRQHGLEVSLKALEA